MNSFSVVIPAYNAESTIEAALASVLAQTLAPLQVIVVDDASQDGTEEIVRRCAQAFSANQIRIQYFRLEKNSGPSAARNKGMREAEGSHVAFLDADDTWSENKLAVVDRFASDPGVFLIFHDYSVSAESAEGLGDPVYDSRTMSSYGLLVRNPAQTSCAVLRNQSHFAFDEAMRHCEDYDLWVRIAEQHVVLRIIGKPLAQLSRPQLTAGGLSGNTFRMRLGELRVYLNFCYRRLLVRIWILPGLVVFSVIKHFYSWLRRLAPNKEFR
jgi:teichuronic acid biosynthesis glycosyltransferase TuaG